MRIAHPSALEHLGRSLLGCRYSPDAAFAMFAAYFDEAGGSDVGYTVVCGYVASVEQWEAFEVDWKLFVIKFNVPYLHMKEFSQSTKCYASWKGNEPLRARFLGIAAEIIASHLKHAFMSIVSHECFDKVNLKYKVRETFSSPYAIAGRSCIAIANDWARKQANGTLVIEHIFEDGGPDKGGLINAVQALPPYLPSPSFKPSRDVKSSKAWPGGRTGLVQLQPADYLAYETRKLAKEVKEQSRRQVRKSFQALARVPLSRSTLGEDRLTTMFEGAETLSPGLFKRK